MVLILVELASISRRLLRVVLPRSRELKWPWPAFLRRIFFLVMVKRLVVALWVLIFGICKNKKQV